MLKRCLLKMQNICGPLVTVNMCSVACMGKLLVRKEGSIQKICWLMCPLLVVVVYFKVSIFLRERVTQRERERNQFFLWLSWFIIRMSITSDVVIWLSGRGSWILFGDFMNLLITYTSIVDS